ncbi:hypothetical protein FJZ20_01265 [Candidatus Pacearchaeota archaeon]|nr:hypothetical protein [Candidatus Pacearchaeota archaeon]
MESPIREDIKDSCSQILYEDERYLIGVASADDSHDLVVNDIYLFLSRGILNEFARSNTRRLKSGLELIGGERILEEMKAKNIPLEELGWVLAKAAINEREDYIDYILK